MTRRGALASGAVLAPGLVLAACGRKSTPSGGEQKLDRGTRVRGDIEVLSAALELEHRLLARYEVGTEAERGRAAALAEQQRAHVDRLRAALRDLGGSPPQQQFTIERAGAFLEQAAALESTAIAAYVDLLPKLGDKPLRGIAAAIAAAHAQQLAVVLGLAGRPQAPDAFVVGEKLA